LELPSLSQLFALFFIAFYRLVLLEATLIEDWASSLKISG
jgi:hypothetical protein